MDRKNQAENEEMDFWKEPIAESVDLDDIKAYDYELDEKLIATTPTERRDQSKLLVFDPAQRELKRRTFEQLLEFLRPRDLLVFNNTRVVPARIQLFKETGGKVELFVLHPGSKEKAWPWEQDCVDGLRFYCMTRSSKPIKPATVLGDPDRPALPEAVVEEVEPGYACVRIAFAGSPAEFLDRFGEVPLPPYIVRQRLELGQEAQIEGDRERYQTVYASVAGAVAAPTAGLHFTRELLEGLDTMGVQRAELTLTVGPGTFQPVRHDQLSEHPMHCEDYFIPEGFGEKVARTKEEGGRVIAVGTTSARALEAEARQQTAFEAGWRSTDIFLRPGSPFLVCDGLITNFHLPRSTLLAMVAAFVGYEELRRLYNVAITEGYRFYSYGDGCLLFRNPSAS